MGPNRFPQIDSNDTSFSSVGHYSSECFNFLAFLDIMYVMGHFLETKKAQRELIGGRAKRNYQKSLLSYQKSLQGKNKASKGRTNNGKVNCDKLDTTG